MCGCFNMPSRRRSGASAGPFIDFLLCARSLMSVGTQWQSGATAYPSRCSMGSPQGVDPSLECLQPLLGADDEHLTAASKHRPCGQPLAGRQPLAGSLRFDGEEQPVDAALVVETRLTKRTGDRHPIVQLYATRRRM